MKAANLSGGKEFCALLQLLNCTAGCYYWESNVLSSIVEPGMARKSIAPLKDLSCACGGRISWAGKMDIPYRCYVIGRTYSRTRTGKAWKEHGDKNVYSMTMLAVEAYRPDRTVLSTSTKSQILVNWSFSTIFWQKPGKLPLDMGKCHLLS